MEHVAYWLAVGAVLWFSLPALTARRQRALGVVLALLLPLFSWAWLVWIGVDHRVHAETRRRITDEQAERQRVARDVAFWRDRARTGTPAEQEAARMYLETLGYAVNPGPAELHAGQLATASTESLAQMSRHYQAVLHAGALSPEGQAAYRAVQTELVRRRDVRTHDFAPRMLETDLPERVRIIWNAPGGLPVVILPEGGEVQVTEQEARYLIAVYERQAQHKLRGNR